MGWLVNKDEELFNIDHIVRLEIDDTNTSLYDIILVDILGESHCIDGFGTLEEAKECLKNIYEIITTQRK